MDHLPYPTHLGVPPIAVPFLNHYRFDHRDFKSFPHRLGFNDHGVSIIECRVHGSAPRTPHNANCELSRSWPELASFCQSWLFFGLIEVFLEKRLDPKKLVKGGSEAHPGSETLDTSILEGLLVDTVRRRGRHRKRAILNYKIESLKIANHAIQAFDALLGGDAAFSAVMLSIRILIIYLTHFFYRGLSTSPDPFESVVSANSYLVPILYAGRKLQISCAAQLLVKRMQHAGWCVHQTTQLLHTHNYWVVYYLSCIPRMEAPSISHSLCSEERCCGYDTGDRGYETLHVEQGCLCALVEVPFNKVASIIDHGGIPLVDLATLTDLRNELEVVEYTSDSSYTAISHVWADGLGNPTRNALPRCQLQKIARQVLALTEVVERPLWKAIASEMNGKSSHSSLLVWFDTLCVPASTAPHEHALRIKAIDKMALIYAAARKVLIIDTELEKFCSESEPTELLLARTVSSKWNTRCWTLQEGSLALRCLFQFHDTAIEPWVYELFSDSSVAESFDPTLPLSETSELESFLRAVEVRTYQKAARHRLLRLFARFIKRYFLLPFLPALPKWRDSNLDQGFGQASLVRSLLVDIRSKRAGRFHMIAPALMMGTPMKRFSLEQYFFDVWKKIGQRSTTKMEDVHAIIANLTNFSAAQILSFPGLVERTKAMLSVMNVLPLDLMFQECPRAYARLDHPDRWIPSTPSSESFHSLAGFQCTEQGLVLQSEIQKDQLYIFIIEGGVLPTRFCFQPGGPEGVSWVWVDCNVEEEDQLPRHSKQKACLMMRKRAKNSQGLFKNQGARLLVANHWKASSRVAHTRYDCSLTFEVKRTSPDMDELVQRPILRAVRLPANQKLVVEYHVDSAIRDGIVQRSRHIQIKSNWGRFRRYGGRTYFYLVILLSLGLVILLTLNKRSSSLAILGLGATVQYVIAMAYHFINDICMYRLDLLVYNAWIATFADNWSGGSRSERRSDRIVEGDIEMTAPLLTPSQTLA